MDEKITKVLCSSSNTAFENNLGGRNISGGDEPRRNEKNEIEKGDKPVKGASKMSAGVDNEGSISLKNHGEQASEWSHGRRRRLRHLPSTPLTGLYPLSPSKMLLCLG